VLLQNQASRDANLIGFGDQASEGVTWRKLPGWVNWPIKRVIGENVSIDDENEDEGHSTPELGDNDTPKQMEKEEYEADGEENPEEEYYLYRLERLLKGRATLRPWDVFIQSVNAQTSIINVQEFGRRFEDFLQVFKLNIPTPSILDELVRSAIQAKKEIAAWEKTVESIRSNEFSKSLDCLQAEVERFATIRRVFRNARRTRSWMSSWERLWIGAFEELEDEIGAQLRGAKSYLENLSELAKLGRTEVESQVLLLSNNSIREVIAQTSLSKTPSVALAAFAYAAQLVRSTDDPDDPKGRYLNAIKSRIKRARCSKVHGKVIGILIMSMTQDPGVGKLRRVSCRNQGLQ
jgi:hypothetical protein